MAVVSAIISTIVARPDADHAEVLVKRMATMLQIEFPEVSAMLIEASEDVTACRHFPQTYRKELRSIGTIERPNVAIKQQTCVVGIFLNDVTALRRNTAVCVDIHADYAGHCRMTRSGASRFSLLDLHHVRGRHHS